MKAYKLTFEENQSGFNSRFSVTAYSQSQVDKTKKYHTDQGKKLVNVEDISTK